MVVFKVSSLCYTSSKVHGVKGSFSARKITALWPGFYRPSGAKHKRYQPLHGQPEGAWGCVHLSMAAGK